jgi:hypothetical protein
VAQKNIIKEGASIESTLTTHTTKNVTIIQNTSLQNIQELYSRPHSLLGHISNVGCHDVPISKSWHRTFQSYVWQGPSFGTIANF